MENMTNFCSSLFEKERLNRSAETYTTIFNDKELTTLGYTVINLKSKQTHSEKDIDKVAELGYN